MVKPDETTEAGLRIDWALGTPDPWRDPFDSYFKIFDRQTIAVANIIV